MDNLNKRAIEYIHEIMEILLSNETISNFFQTTIEALQERENKWSNDQILIGMIGVTSSGKSSLLNAMMGEKILPERVKPSTGVLAWCTKSEKREAKIKFHKFDIIILRENDLAPENIAEYADESKNPENHKSVDSIEVYHPEFIFDKGITLIDSPGLDAEGYDQHEIMTLIRLLPLLDICLLVIPSKPNSDKMFLEYITKVVKAQKPIIILENMKDAIEGAKHPDGSAIYSRDQELEQHLKRINNNLVVAGIDPDSVNVLQVSARRAMDSRLLDDDYLFEESGFSKLKEIIQRLISERKPLMNRSRLYSLNHFLETRVIEEDKMSVEFNSASPIKNNADITPDVLQKKYNQFTNVLTEIEILFNSIPRLLERVIQKVDTLSHKDFKKAELLISLFRNRLKVVEIKINTKIETADLILRELLLDLSMSLSDYKAIKIDATEYPEKNPNVTSSKTIKYEVNKKGLLNLAKRKLKIGDRGVEKKEKIVEELDYEKTRSFIYTLHNRHIQRFQSIINKWKVNRTSAKDDIYGELQHYKSDYERRQRKAFQEREILNVFGKLKNITNEIHFLISDIENEVSEKQTNYDKEKSGTKYQSMEISTTTLWLHSQTQQFIHSQLNLALNSNRAIASSNSIVIAGWNEEMLTSFLSNFYSVTLNSNSLGYESDGYLDIKTNSKTIRIINLRIYNLQDQSGLIEQLSSNNVPLILLLNIQQLGNTLAQLSGSEFITALGENDISVILVMESIVEGINSHSLSEFVFAFDDLIQFINSKKIKVVGSFVNHTNPLYSKLLNSIYLNQDFSVSTRLKSIDRIISENRVFFKGETTQRSVHEFSMGLRNLIKE